jgi:hypothetical protein
VSDAVTQVDFFDQVRRVAVVMMIAAGAAAIIGSVIDWVVITERPELQPGVDFGDATEGVESPEVTEPFTGLEASYGTFSLAGGIALVIGGVLLTLRRRGKYAWLGFLGAVVAGGIAIAAYRGIADDTSALYRSMDIIGRAEPAVGLTLVAAGAIVGLIASVVGIASTPYRGDGD